MPEHKKKYNNAIEATLSGIKDLMKKRARIEGLKESERLDGKTVMITGASSGLGFATAVSVARLGARVIMACRSGIPEKGREVTRLSGNEDIRMLHVDLLDFNSINSLIKELEHLGQKIDVLISNAAMVPGGSRKSAQGLEEMFVVNYLSKFYLINQLLAKNAFASSGSGWPRIVIVSSESHRNPEKFEWDRFGVYEEYKMKDVVNRYSYFKLLLTTFAVELSERLNVGNHTNIAVRALCPGPVNSNIAREAPNLIMPLLKFVFKIFFRSPEVACEPVVYMAAHEELDPEKFDYLFLMSKQSVDPKVMDKTNGIKLWSSTERLLKEIGFELSSPLASPSVTNPSM